MFVRKMRRCVWAVAAAMALAASAAAAADPPRARLPLGSPNALLCIRVKDLGSVIKAVTDVASQFDPNAGPMVGMQMRAALQKLPGIEENAPLAVLLLDPKKYKVPLVGVFTLKDPDLFKNIPDMQTVTVGKLGISANDEGAMAEVAQEIKAKGLRAVPTGDMTDMVVVSADMPAVIKRYKMDIQGGLQLLKLKLGGMPADPAAPPDPTRQMGIKALGYVEKLVQAVEEQSGVVSMGATLTAREGTLNLAADAVPGSDFATFLRGMTTPANKELTKFLPKEAYVTSVSTVDPAARAKLAVGMVKAVGDVLGLAQAETDTICKVIHDATANMTGLEAGAAIAVKDGQAGIALSGIRDKDKAREITRGALALVKTGKIGEFFTKYGITVSLAERHRNYQNIPVDKVEVVIDMDKLVAALPVPPEAKVNAKQQLGQVLKMAYGFENKIVAEMVYGKKLVVVAYGLEYDKLIEKQIGLMKSGGADGIGSVAEYMAALDRHPRSSSTLWHFSLFGYADVLGKMMAKNMGPMMPANMFPTRAELPAKEVPISGSARVEGDRLLMTIHVPVDPIKAFADVMKRKMQKAMQEMMQRGAEPGGVRDAR